MSRRMRNMLTYLVDTVRRSRIQMETRVVYVHTWIMTESYCGRDVEEVKQTISVDIRQYFSPEK
jgi:hypothetical protein